MDRDPIIQTVNIIVYKRPRGTHLKVYFGVTRMNHRQCNPIPATKFDEVLDSRNSDTEHLWVARKEENSTSRRQSNLTRVSCQTISSMANIRTSQMVRMLSSARHWNKGYIVNCQCDSTLRRSSATRYAYVHVQKALAEVKSTGEATGDLQTRNLAFLVLLLGRGCIETNYITSTRGRVCEDLCNLKGMRLDVL